MSKTLSTCLGVFFRLHCRHQQLFEKEYKRSNRNRGTKILRCFPHCCPSHVERSYCGSSLELAVEMHHPIPVDANSLFVFARFETIDLETTLVVGEHYSLRHLMSVSQSEANPEATWVQGVMQNRAASSAKPTTRVFLLNGQTSAKWYYHWESGANKARRLTKHVLKAYIFYRRPQGDPSDLVQVISTVSSPQFTLVSYRRAAWEGLDGMDVGSYPVDNDGGDYDLNQVVQDQISQAFQDFQRQAGGGGGGGVSGDSKPSDLRVLEAKPLTQLQRHQYQQQQRHLVQGTEAESLDPDDLTSDDADCVCESCAHYRRARPPVTSAPLRDQWIWERQHTAMALHMRDLAIVYYLVSNVPMTFAMQSFRVREHIYAAMQHHWGGNNPRRGGAADSSRGSSSTGRSMSSLRQPAVLLSHLFPGGEGSTTTVDSAHSLGVTGTSSGAMMNSQVENLLLVVSKLVIWLLSKENVELFQDFFDAHATVLLRKKSLRDAFLHFAGLVCKLVHVFWSREVKTAASDVSASRDSAFKALRTMSEHVISLSLSHSHSHVRFQPMWPDLRDILEAPGTILWETFITQLRDTYARKQSLHPRTNRTEPPSRALARFSGCWCVDASTAAIDQAISTYTHGTTPDTESPTISAMLLAIAQLQQLVFRVAGPDTIMIRSEHSLLPNQNPWMTLVCDETPRITSVFPMGLSSLIGSQVFGGDYVGGVNRVRSRIHIELYWWPLCSSKTICHWHAIRVLLSLQLHADASAMDASFELQHGAITTSEIARDRIARMDLWSAKERLALHVGWSPVWKASVSYTTAAAEAHVAGDDTSAR